MEQTRQRRPRDETRARPDQVSATTAVTMATTTATEAATSTTMMWRKCGATTGPATERSKSCDEDGGENDPSSKMVGCVSVEKHGGAPEAAPQPLPPSNDAEVTRPTALADDEREQGNNDCRLRATKRAGVKSTTRTNQHSWCEVNDERE